MLNLAEELLVLALDDSNGKVHSSAAASLEFGLAGAILMDLGLAGKLSFEQERLEVVDAAPVGDSILDHTEKSRLRIGSGGSRSYAYHLASIVFVGVRGYLRLHSREIVCSA